ncbi:MULTISPECIES: response regulator [Marichromatium]|uniref:Histidine kinase n=2 Tax=Marichromatium TaxID=85076 RepID=A0A4R4AJR9_MARGR|nr:MULTISPECIES: response regulator [Marichromatium]MBO8085486.1 response regulator [Marichromatium sp.]KXX64280.1 histidine kinase [Marichromatium gracile]MBK1710552.1 response regulator [Marichromatium gracile]NKN34322.1 response regulator [Marichromatium bheemlicum]RNE92235.1 response regulator [Marichromatium sp. AB31]
MTKILIVDDDDLFRTMLVEMVRREGYEVSAVSNGKEALEHIEHDRPQLIITDILMPEMDGIELIMEQNRRGNTIPVIAISGGRRAISLEFNLESAELMGVRATLPKPFTREQLRSAITEALQ